MGLDDFVQWPATYKALHTQRRRKTAIGSLHDLDYVGKPVTVQPLSGISGTDKLNLKTRKIQEILYIEVAQVESAVEPGSMETVIWLVQQLRFWIQ